MICATGHVHSVSGALEKLGTRTSNHIPGTSTTIKVLADGHGMACMVACLLPLYDLVLWTSGSGWCVTSS